MKKILRITTIPQSLDSLLKGQLKYVGNHGFNVIVASNGEGNINELQKRENVKHFVVPMTRKFNPFYDIFSLIHAIRLIIKEKPDIVHSHTPKAGIVGMLASLICGVKLKIHTVAGLPLTEATGFKKWILIQVERLTYFCADFVLPNSIEQSDYICKNIYSNKEKINVIGMGSSNGVDLDYFNADHFNEEYKYDLKEKLGINEKSIVFVFVGRLANYKGINELITAFTNAKKGYGNLKLVLVGPLEEINPLEDSTLLHINNDNDIITVGFQSDIRCYLAIGDVFVFPSYREGFPQSLMQAAAMRLPSIATDINGCNEIVKDRISGILIKPKSVEELQAAMELLIINPDLRRQYAEEGYNFISENFEQKKFWDKLLKFYDKAQRK